MATSPTIDKPQLPRPVAIVKGKTWDSLWDGIATLSKQNQNLVQYLQTYLTLVYNWLVPPKFNISVVLPPYAVNATDAFIAATGGPVNLPQSSGGGRIVVVKNVDTVGGVVAVTPYGTDTIDGGAVVNITLMNDAVRFIDAAVGQWFVW